MKKLFFLSIALSMLMTSFVFANSDFNHEEFFSEYVFYDDIAYKVDGAYYIATKTDELNSYAIFKDDEQKTDFIYNGYSESGFYPTVVWKNINGIDYYGLFDTDMGFEIIPCEYKYITYVNEKNITIFILTDFNGNEEYIIPNSYYKKVQQQYTDFEVSGEVFEHYIKINSLKDIPFPYTNMTAIIGAESYYIGELNGFYYIIDGTDGDIKRENLRKVDYKLNKYNTLDVEFVYKEGSYYSVLDENMNMIIPLYSEIGLNVMDYGDEKYFINNKYTAYTEYYDFERNKIDDIYTHLGINDIGTSNWAKSKVQDALVFGVVPENLQGDYKANITREEFCQLAIQTLITYNELNRNYANDIDVELLTAESKFTDTDSKYVALAYDLGIVKGRSDTTFAPNEEITRQEAAVMLTNLASLMDLKLNVNTAKYIDESYFASWANDSIRKISGKASNGQVIMGGTETNKFSPLLKYSREQAIVTMMRMLTQYA